MHSARPTLREIQKRIDEARCVLLKSPGLFAHPAKAVGELYELGIGDTSELWDLIIELLDEIKSQDYAGGHPPQKSYENNINGCELMAFCWLSHRMNKKMYIKFALKDTRYYYVSLHKSRFEDEEEMTV